MAVKGNTATMISWSYPNVFRTFLALFSGSQLSELGLSFGECRSFGLTWIIWVSSFFNLDYLTPIVSMVGFGSICWIECRWFGCVSCWGMAGCLAFGLINWSVSGFCLDLGHLRLCWIECRWFGIWVSDCIELVSLNFMVWYFGVGL